MDEPEQPPTPDNRALPGRPQAARMAMVGLVALALVARMSIAYVVSDYQASRLPESPEYAAIASNVYSGAGFVLPTRPGEAQGAAHGASGAMLARFPPGYPLILAAAMATGDGGLCVALVFQVLCGAAVVLLAGWAAWRMAGPWAGVVAAALLAFDPYQVYFAAMAVPTVPLVLALTLVTLAGLKFVAAGSIEPAAEAAGDAPVRGVPNNALAGKPPVAPGGLVWAALAGIGLAAAAYLEAWTAGLAVLAGLAAVFSTYRKQYMAGWAIGAAVMLVALAPWIIRNQVRLGAPALATAAGYDLLVGTLGAGPDPAAEIAGEAQALDEVGCDVFYVRLAARRIADAPLGWLGLAAGRAGRLWSGSPLAGDDRGPVSPLAGYTGLLPAVALALVGLWRLRRERAVAAWLLVVPAYATLACAIAAVPIQARLAMMPSLAILAGVGVMAILGPASRKISPP